MHRRPCLKHWGGGRRQELTFKAVCWPLHACLALAHTSPTHIYTGTCIQKIPGHEATILYSLGMKGFLNYIFKWNTIISLPPPSPSQLPFHIWYTYITESLGKAWGTSRRKGQKGCKSQNTRKSAGKIFPRNGCTKRLVQWQCQPAYQHGRRDISWVPPLDKILQFTTDCWEKGN